MTGGASMIREEQYQRILDQVTDLCDLYGISVPSQNGARTIITKVWQAILNYCNIDTVPQALESVWGDMAMDYLRYILATKAQQSTNGGSASGTAPTPTFISSINEMSVSVGFSADSSSEQSRSAMAHDVSNGVDGVLMNYVDQLNRYRRMTW